ncbi:MAG: type I DNA topoisomerase [Ignavibacteriae bacterium]|nr:type I DNA topoisomerase [Ignavibacteriota bacterium]
MDKSLIIVESPAKAKTISKYLGKNFVVQASVGHIKNLPKSDLGVDVNDDYTPTFEIIDGKVDVIKKLREAASKSKDVYIATDPDREGEAIAADIADEIAKDNRNIYRVLFHEITENGITEAMKVPQKINHRLVASQRARRVMDRIVGYKISPFVWKTVYYGLSAGRVQSVALRLICEREVQINSFIPTEYWSIIGEFKTQMSDPFLAKLVRIDEKDLIVPRKEILADIERKGTQNNYTYIPSEADAKAYIDDVQKQTFVISDVQRRDVKRNPPAPFITSTLQQEAASRLRFPSKRTMSLAQKLYEGVKLGDEGLVGLITYIRTDSTRLSNEAVASVREYIYNNYGKEYLPNHPIVYKKKKTSQDAHEAIRPTNLRYTPKSIKKYLDEGLYALYELIWNRFVACQMNPAIYDQVTVGVKGGEYLFRATESIPKFRGFLQVYDDLLGEDSTSEDEDPTSKVPQNLHVGERASLLNIIPKQHFTKPPPRYTERSLVKDLEALGIGRPSTYAMIVSTILDRKYVEQKDRKLYALQLGMGVNRLLTTNFPDIFNVKFTAKMEEELDTIASGKRDYKTVLDDFYLPFNHSLERVSKNASAIKKSMQEVTDEVCELCGKHMIIKWGRNGKFMACSGYPECKNTKPLPEDQEKHQHLAGMKCDVCGGEMLVRSSKFGTFLGCSNYPKCKNTKSISMGIKCPKCKEGDLIERKTKRKRTFYGCSRYPDCDFASWDKPTNQPCETCGSPYMVIKYSEKRGEYLKCPSCKSEVEKEEVAVVSS